MHKSNKQLYLIVLILVLSLVATSVTVFARPSMLGTSPILGDLIDFSVLGGAAVTNTGPTTTTGKVGVSPGTSITGFPPGTADGGLHFNDQTAIDAQTEAGIVFGQLDQNCDETLGAGLVELGGRTLVPGVYCAGSFSLNGTLTLTGGAEEVYIFKSASTLITSSGSSVVGGDPCHVWWRVGSSATLGTNSSLIGNVFSQTGVSAMSTGATLNGRFIGLTPVTVTLDNNTIFGPVCGVPAATQTAIAATQTATVEAATATVEAATQTAQAATQAAVSTATATPGLLPDTGGDLAGPGSQIIRISLGALGLILILVGFMLSRRNQKVER